MELNREQIAGILEIIANSHYGNFYIISPAQMLLLTKIIKELTEENERLENALIEQSAENVMLCGEVKHARADTVREMQERLKSLLKTDYINGTREHALSVIDQIAKEMLEGKK